MCGRFILVQKIETLEKRFNATADFELNYKTSYNIHPGAESVIIPSDKPNKIVNAIFGMSPEWSKKQMYLFNARAEGDRNKDNDPNYKGSMNIINKPAFRKPIRTERCLVPADAFIEGTTNEGLSYPYLIFLRNKERPFSFAGLFSDWKNPISGKIIRSFSIITTTANELLLRIPHHRSPVILSKHNEKKWLNLNTPLHEITDLLRPYNHELMNAYPISNAIKQIENNSDEIILPLGDFFYAENGIKISKSVSNQGFGRKNRKF